MNFEDLTEDQKALYFMIADAAAVGGLDKDIAREFAESRGHELKQMLETGLGDFVDLLTPGANKLVLDWSPDIDHEAIQSQR